MKIRVVKPDALSDAVEDKLAFVRLSDTIEYDTEEFCNSGKCIYRTRFCHVCEYVGNFLRLKLEGKK